MKKFFVTIVAALMTIAMVNAQDLAEVTEIYNNAATYLNSGDKLNALSSFEQALSLAELLEEGAGTEIVSNCKGIIPSLSLSIAKDHIGADQHAEAIERLKSTLDIAAKYEADDVIAEANDLLPKILMKSAGVLFNSKKYAESVAAYKEVLELNPGNGVAAYRLGLALNASGDVAAAKEALIQAMANGQEANAKKQLSTISLKEAAAALKTKKYDEAVEAALSSIEYNSNSQAYRIAGQASQLAGKNDNAIKYYEQLLELFPNDKNAGSIAFTVGAMYQSAKNNAKAVEYYQKAVNDPKYGAEAQKMLDLLK